jgi:uncharacterized protein
MRMTNIEKRKLSIKKAKNGKGIFTKNNFKKDEVILEIQGKLITCYEDDNLDEQTRSNTIRYDQEMFLSPKGKLGNYINHSCDPNTKIIKKGEKLYIISLNLIQKNSEIFFDYSTVLARDDSWQMKCNCGSDNCRKIIKSFNKLPKKIKDFYIKNKIVPKYILAIK